MVLEKILEIGYLLMIIENLLKQLKQSGFKCTMYRDSDSKNSSNIAGYLYGFSCDSDITALCFSYEKS